MEVEFWVALSAVFVSGGAIGAAGTMLAQFLMRKIQGGYNQRVPGPSRVELEMMRREMTEIAFHLGSVEERLDFTEQLLSGSNPMTRPRPVSGGPRRPDAPDAPLEPPVEDGQEG